MDWFQWLQGVLPKPQRMMKCYLEMYVNNRTIPTTQVRSVISELNPWWCDSEYSDTIPWKHPGCFNFLLAFQLQSEDYIHQTPMQTLYSSETSSSVTLGLALNSRMSPPIVVSVLCVCATRANRSWGGTVPWHYQREVLIQWKSRRMVIECPIFWQNTSLIQKGNSPR